MCINCNLALPVKKEITQKFNIPEHSLLSHRDLAKIFKSSNNDPAQNTGGGLLSLVSSTAPDNWFEPNLHTINYVTRDQFKWNYENVIDTDYFYSHYSKSR